MISALVLAAGQSKRMGSPKMLLAWRGSTVLGHVIQVLQAASVDDILVVTGGDRQAVEDIALSHKVRTIFNPQFASDEMLSSLQVGLQSLGEGTSAALIALGDQPQIQESTVRLVVDEYARTSEALIVPSYQMHRGHPWLLGRELWDAILHMRSPESPRDFLNRHAAQIHYVALDTPTIIQDLDTPEDYLDAKP